MRSTAAPIECLCLLSLAACAGNGEGLDANGRPLGSGGGGVLTADLASIQEHVFTPICTQCHAGASAAQGLRLDAGASYNSLVGVASSESPSVLRVRPGDPGRSYLVQKLEGRASVGARMPLDQPALPDATIEVIKQWITDGALREPGAGGFVVELVTGEPEAISVGFNRSVDSNLVDANSVMLEQLDATTGAARIVSARAAVSRHNDALVRVLPDGPLVPGTYRLRLRGGDPYALADWAGVALDGDRDGRPGGDHVVVVTILESP